MRWSIEELFYGLKIASHSGRWWVYRIIHLPRDLWRMAKVVFHWIFTGYCWATIWDLDYYLIDIFIKRLEEFRKLSPSGYPCNLKSEDEWMEIIDRLIVGFKVMRDESLLDYPKGKIKDVPVKIGDKEIMGITFERTEQEEKAMLDAIEKQRQHDKETMRLFGEYIRDLWD